jgi:hypothetical protein
MKSNSKYITLTSLSENIQGKVDYFITSASYEERCLKVADEIKKINPTNAIVCCNTANSYNSKNLDYLKALFGNSFSLLELHSNNPSLNNDALLLKVISIKAQNPKLIIVDITTFTHETLLILFRLLKLILSSTTAVKFVYLEASDYSWNIDKVEDKWLSKGIGEIRSIVGYPGLFNPSKGTHLIILVGFESDRTIKLIEKYDSTIVSLGLGVKKTPNPSDKIIIEMARKKQQELVNQFPHVRVFDFCLESSDETKVAIEKQIALYPSLNVIVAPMNNKVSTIGAGILGIDKFEVQLCYVKANQYNTGFYSKPGTSCYLFDLSR